jgi:hypothetical protein
MSLTLTNRELRGAKIYFIPAGTVVDSVTVAIATWPDADPVTNWTNYEFGDVVSVNRLIETQDQVFTLVRASGGAQNETDKHLRGVKLQVVTPKTNALVKQLDQQLLGIPVAGTAQAPGVKGKPQIDGVLLVEVFNGDGAIIEREQVWARFTVVTGPPVAGAEVGLITVQFERLYSANNTFVVPA